MRIVPAIILTLVSSAAVAAECDRWTAGMQEDEGGPRMMASICTGAGAPDMQHELLVQCGGGRSLWFRYLPFADQNYPPGDDEEYKTKLELSLGPEMFTLDARFEGMDGAMAMETDIDKPLVTLFMSRKELVISDAAGKIPGATFTLKGANEAFKTLLDSCEK